MMSSSVPSELEQKYPAKQHTHRVVSYLRKHEQSGDVNESVLYLESAHTKLNEDNDQEAPFRQRRYFYYVSGCALPDSAIVYDTKIDRSTLFIPAVDPDEVIWSGLPMMREEALKAHDVDDVQTMDKLENHLAQLADRPIYAIADQASPNPFHNRILRRVNYEALKTAIEECRVVKTPYEIALIKHANAISAIAHRGVMKAAEHATNECELEALFVQRCAHHGARNQAYSAIIASGTDAATLHYVRNDKALLTADVGPMQQKQEGKGPSDPLNLLIDAGAEFRCYASDVTRTFPLNGKFSKESREIYALVLKAQKACAKILKPDIEWEKCHQLAHRVVIEGLLALGILKGGNVDELIESRISTAFLPHGLGHYMGMNTHDSGGHANYADTDPMFKYLRVRGKVPKGAVITIEPGCYFCRFIIEPRLKTDAGKKYIDADVLERYWSVGGVRIEDDYLVSDGGCENLTQLPSEIEEIEALVRG